MSTLPGEKISEQAFAEPVLTDEVLLRRTGSNARTSAEELAKLINNTLFDDATPGNLATSDEVVVKRGTSRILGKLVIDTVSANRGNASVTLTHLTSETIQIFNTALTANRTVTLSTTNAVNGAKFRVVRTAAATGAFNLSVGAGPLKNLSAGQWCDVAYNGAAWVLVAYGSL